ncbi:hypothetical protein ANRL3_02106 [Anaerolineae bacterium]|nr:hypothetical protein ANRL3_02106 [Anaerolineae bacterium]
MFCPSCGKQISDKGAYCLHCGARILTAIDTVNVPDRTDWVYKDFVHRFPAGKTWVRIGSDAYTETEAKLEFWQNAQQEIRLEIQTWLDEDWKPVGEIGPASVCIRTYWGAKLSLFGWLVVLIITIPLFGLPLLAIWHTYAEPTEFRVTMRCPVRPGVEIAKPTEIIIRRPPQFTNSGGVYGVIIDDSPVGSIRNGTTETFDVAPGKHTVHLEIVGYQSKKIAVDLAAGDKVALVCHANPLTNLVRLEYA